MDNLIRLDNVNKIYGEKVQTQVLFDINLSINEGEFCSVIGPSGSGKSSLLNIIGALQRPTNGDVFINNEQINDMNDKQLTEIRKNYIGFIYQSSNLMPDFSVIENVLIPFYILKGKPNKQDIIEAENMLERVGLKDKINNKSTDLSGGQKQRVSVARALIGNKKIILADEPTGALDSKSGKEIFEIMKAMNKEKNITFIIITHDNEIALKTNRVISIFDGKITKDEKNN